MQESDKPLYHGSDIVIVAPELDFKKKTDSDFGKGFYCSVSYDQAERWALEKWESSENEYAAVSFYKLEKIPSSFKILKFDGPTLEWIRFVKRNRKDFLFDHEYDIVIGPIADNNLKRLFKLEEEGIITEEELRSKAYKSDLKDQFLFHTERAKKLLTFLSAIEVKKINNKILRREWIQKK